MARIRSIHPDARKSKKLARCSAEAERLYWRLQTHCDDQGRCEDDAEEIAPTLFPLRVARQEITLAQVSAWLDELAEVGLIVRYTVGKRHYLAVSDFPKYQKPQHPQPSKIPAPPADDSTVHEEYANAHEGSRNGHESSGAALLGVGVGEGVVRAARGTRIPDEFTVSDEMVVWVQAECPSVNWRVETEAFVDWAKSCTSRAAIKTDWGRAWKNWMRRAQKEAPRQASRTHL